MSFASPSTLPEPPSSALADANLAGTIVGGKYRVVRLIGRGGMGTVWEGRHQQLGHLVAIKFIHPHLSQQPESRMRFEVEARAAARLRSRHAAAVYDHGLTELGQPYIVMEYLEGQTLDQAIVERGPLPPQEVSHIVNGAARALQAAHASGVVHRDLKPDNIFLARDADTQRDPYGYTVKLVDFGIAKILHEAASQGALATQAGMVLGTPHFMSPEALTASAPVGPATDLWSLGACVYAALVARLPFDGSAIGDVLLKVCSAPLPVPSKWNSKVPKGFDAWFARACDRDPSRRFSTATEFAEELARVCAPEDSGASAEEHYRLLPAPAEAQFGELSVPPARLSTKTALLAGVIFGGALAIFAVGGLAWNQKSEAEGILQRTAASATAIVEAENERRLAAFALESADSGPRAAPADSSSREPSGPAAPRRKK